MTDFKNIQIVMSNETNSNEKLLLKIRRNDNAWLSPIGWKDYETSTLLPYVKVGNTIQILLSEEHAKRLKSEDTLLVTSYELGLEQKVAWETASHIQPYKEEKKPEKSGSFLSKLKAAPKDSPAPTPPQSETERRVADAERATEDYRAKMEAATAAQEEATRRAKEAARQAEEALRLEAERAAEMERAAKAFEEAEHLKMEEMRRIEEERRLEEERLAEEARRIEAARQRQLAAKREAERQAALKRFSSALDVTQNENRDLQKRVDALQSKTKTLTAESLQKTEKMSQVKETLEKTHETVATRQADFDKKRAVLDTLSEAQAKLHEEADALKADRHHLSQELTTAEKDYALAQKLVEDAVARAESQRVALEAKRRKDTEMLKRISETSEKLGHQSRMVSEASVKAQELKSKVEIAQSKLSQAKLENETLEQEKLSLKEALQSLEYDMEVAQSSVEALQQREQEYIRTLAHLEAGGSADEIDGLLTPDEPLDISHDITLTETEKTAAPLSLASKPAAKLSFPVETTVSKPSFLAGIATNAKNNLNSRNTFMTVAVLLGGAAIIGGTYVTLDAMNSRSLIVKNNVPTPEDVASAVTEIETIAPNITPEMDVDEAVTEITEPEKLGMNDSVILQAAEPVSLTETDAPETTEGESATGKKPIQAKVEIPAPEIKPEPEVSKPIVKEAALTIVEKTPKTVSVKAPGVIFETKPEAVSEPKPEPQYYPELTMDVQSKLTELGFYYGEQNGEMSDETKAAISDFKSLYGLPTNSDISGPFINQLSKALIEREEAIQMAALTIPSAPSAITPLDEDIALVDVTDAPITLPVQTSDAPETTFSTVSEPVDENAPNEITEPINITEPVKLAAAPVSVPKSEVPATPADIIVEANLIKALSSSYPRKAERVNHWVNVTVAISYDIDSEGNPINIKVAETDYSGRFADEFEEAAIKTISRARYEPKTVNGVAVVSKDNEKRIIFRGE